MHSTQSGTKRSLRSIHTWYDAEGNRVARFVDVDGSGTLSTGDTAVTEYAWDARNRLVKVTDRTTAGGQATQVVDYLYDAENRWIGQVIDRDGDGLIDHRTAHIYDGNQIALQFDKDASGDITASDLSRRYLWQANAVDQLMADEQLAPASTEEGGNEGHSLSAPGDVVWTLGDHLGTVRDLAVYDSETGITTVANHRVYDSFGNLTSQTNAASDCLFGFTGRPFDQAAGLQNNLHRWYDAATGGWVSKDPIGYKGLDANLYRYVANSPTNATDPSGRSSGLTETLTSLLAMPPRFLSDVVTRTVNAFVENQITQAIADAPDHKIHNPELLEGLEVQIPVGSVSGIPVIFVARLKNTSVAPSETVPDGLYEVSWDLTVGFRLGELTIDLKKGTDVVTNLKDLERKGKETLEKLWRGMLRNLVVDKVELAMGRLTAYETSAGNATLAVMLDGTKIGSWEANWSGGQETAKWVAYVIDPRDLLWQKIEKLHDFVNSLNPFEILKNAIKSGKKTMSDLLGRLQLELKAPLSAEYTINVYFRGWYQ
jgi:RHS repeat-associated protein